MDGNREVNQQNGKRNKWNWGLIREWIGVFGGLGLIISIITLGMQCGQNEFNRSLHNEVLTTNVVPLQWDYQTGVVDYGSEDYPSMIFTKWACMTTNVGEIPVVVDDFAVVTSYEGRTFRGFGSTPAKLDNTVVTLPWSLQPGDSLTFVVTVHVPLTNSIWNLLSDEYPVTYGSEDYSINDIYSFLEREGVDFYGNEVQVLNPGLPRGIDFNNFIGISSIEQINRPEFKLILHTAKGTEFIKTFAHYDRVVTQSPEWWVPFI